MPKPILSDAELVKKLTAHPDLRSRIESLVLAVEDETGELKTADAAAMRTLEMMRRTGQASLATGMIAAAGSAVLIGFTGCALAGQSCLFAALCAAVTLTVSGCANLRKSGGRTACIQGSKRQTAALAANG